MNIDASLLGPILGAIATVLMTFVVSSLRAVIKTVQELRAEVSDLQIARRDIDRQISEHKAGNEKDFDEIRGNLREDIRHLREDIANMSASVHKMQGTIESIERNQK